MHARTDDPESKAAKLAEAAARAAHAPDIRHATRADQVRVLTLNTHRGQGPTLRCLLENGTVADRERDRMLHQTRAYTFHIADWLRRNADRYDVVGLQEVFQALLGGLDRLWTRRAAQHRVYKTISGFRASYVHPHSATKTSSSASSLPSAAAAPSTPTCPGACSGWRRADSRSFPSNWESTRSGSETPTCMRTTRVNARARLYASPSKSAAWGMSRSCSWAT